MARRLPGTLVGLVVMGGCLVLQGCPMLPPTYDSPPKTIATTPDTGALLLVDADLKAPLASFALTGAVLVEEGDPTRPMRRSNVSRGWFKMGGLVLFEVSVPGSYRLVGLRGDTANSQIVFDLARREGLVHDVALGSLVFFGVVKARAKMFQTEPEVEVEQDREREREAWEEILEEYPDSEWAPAIEARIATLTTTP